MSSPNAPVAVKWNSMTVYRPPHQLGAPDTTVPKYNYVPSQAGNLQGAFQTSGTYLKFKLPKAIGTVYNTSLRFLINNGTSNAVPAPPTPHWVQSIEVHVGSATLETLYPQDIYNETLGFLNLDQLGAVRAAINASNSDYVSGDNLAVGQNYRYLPFNNCLPTARIYNKGIEEDIEYWVYFPESLFGGNANVILSDCQLIVEEDTHVSGDEDRWKAASRSTLVYNTVIRQRQQTSVARISTGTNTIDLTGLKGNSAGLIVYANSGVKPTGSNAAALTARYSIDSLEVNNQLGNKRTETLRGEWLQSFSWTDNVQTPYASLQPTYLIPFCADFRGAVENGANSGSINFDSTDRLVVGKAAVTRTENISITNYIYAQIIVSAGKYDTLNT
jgi:hypothetical protein